MKALFEVAAACVFLGMSVPFAEAHEFWIEGDVDDNGKMLSLDLKVGQDLNGISLPYLPENVAAFEWVSGGTGKITGTIGDVPSTRVPFKRQSGAIVFHRTEPRRLIHNDWKLFLQYLDMEGLTEIAEEHAARGLPQIGFSEDYARHAKLLVVPTTSETIEDRYLGSSIEFVIDQVERRGTDIIVAAKIVTPKGPSQSQVTVFRHGSNDTTKELLRPDASGRFEVRLHESDTLLLNAVAMRPATDLGVAWRSDWASLRILP